MDNLSQMPPAMAQTPSAMGGAPDDESAEPQQSAIPVPLAMLTMPDDTEQMQTPAEGDSVDFQVTATVSKIVGDTAFVTPSAINGKPLDDEQGEGDNQPDADASEGDDLRQEAAGMSGMAPNEQNS